MSKLYDPEKPPVKRVRIQGGVMVIQVCTENANINQDIQSFSQAISDLGKKAKTYTYTVQNMVCRNIGF